jgi:exodeoxyribonuclease-5
VNNDRQCKLILIGDAAQLPPVGLDISPALDVKVLEGFGFTVQEAFLSEVIRQSAESGILYNATYLRNLLGKGRIGQPKFSVRDHNDILTLSGGDFLEELDNAYQKYGRDQVIVVTRSNKRANQFNKGIRDRILWREEEIVEGDYVMVVKNNYFWLDEDEPTNFIANGDIAEILQIEGYQERYGFRFADVVLRFPDYSDLEIPCKIILDSLMIDSASLGQEKNRELYMNILEDFPEIKAKRKQYLKVREHPFFNALQVKFAYAVTCHKAQGGQWEVVFLDQGYISEEMINIEYIRWLYTAFTRATRRLYLVNFHSRYFKE